jgi:hypothetical protein
MYRHLLYSGKLYIEYHTFHTHSSAAAILLTTEVAIAEEPKKESSAPDMGGMGGGMGMDY